MQIVVRFLLPLHLSALIWINEIPAHIADIEDKLGVYLQSSAATSKLMT